MTVIYLDVLFLLNLIVDYLLLMATARITGESFSRLRLALGAVLGGTYAAAVFLPGLAWLAHPLCKVAAAVGMVLLAFGGSRRLLRLVLVFFGASCALGGIVLALQWLGTGGLTLEQGVLYTGFDVRLLLVSVLVTYAVLTLAFRRVARHGGGRQDLCRGQLWLGEKTLCLTVLLDTGNTLTDPANNRPVMVVEARAMEQLLPPEIDPTDPVGSMERIQGDALRRRLQLLPYRAVGVEYGVLLAVRTDRAMVGNREEKGLLVALSPTPVSDGGAYQALMGEI